MLHPCELGEALRSARQGKGFSQRHVARAAGISEAELSRIEGCKRTPSLDTLVRLARALGVRVVVDPALGVLVTRER